MLVNNASENSINGMYNSIFGFVVSVNDGGDCQGAAYCHLVIER